MDSLIRFLSVNVANHVGSCLLSTKHLTVSFSLLSAVARVNHHPSEIWFGVVNVFKCYEWYRQSECKDVSE